MSGAAEGLGIRLPAEPLAHPAVGERVTHDPERALAGGERLVDVRLGVRVRDVEAGEVEDGTARRRLLEEEAHQKPLGLRRAVVEYDLRVHRIADGAGRDAGARGG